MSDEAPRPTPGPFSDQRRGRGAPTWWDQLQRADLPEDPDEAMDWPVRTAHERDADRLDRTSRAGATPGRAGAGSRWRTAAITALALATFVVVVLLGMEATSPRSAAVIVLVLGVPAGVALLTAVVVSRLHR